MRERLGGIKKFVLVGLTAVAGLLLTLSGLNLIEISGTLIFYTGLLLLVLSVLIYIFN